ncbi:MAG TPA: neuraminidase-like domain-containing protein [Patescibacteria group bacterium]|nr:neuraminidase-like domain-containing protein [Patescibacteria group bacterium]
MRELADLEEADWKKLIEKKVDGKPIGFPPDTPGKDDAEKIGNYTRALAAAVEKAVPTAVFAARFKRKGIPGTEDVKTDIDIFFANNQDFDFRTTYIEKYFADNPSLNALPNKDALKSHLKKAQRIFKLTPRFDEIRDLLADGLDSALGITLRGRRNFIKRHSNPVKNPGMAWDKANNVTAITTTLFAEHSPVINRFYDFPWLPTRPAKIDGFPDWASLFGSLSFCECEHCRSVYSPAAYLVDLLHFLKNNHLKTADSPEEMPALDVLFERRPDIGEIELSCENTNTPLPYVDLVNEVLENAVAPVRFSLALGLAADLDAGTISPELTHAFAAEDLELSDHASVVVVESGARWHVVDKGWRFLIKLEEGELRVSAPPQTTWTVQELSANPEHVNSKAYDKLRDAVYPLNLPLNLWVEEARLYLDHLGVQRFELMETFQRQGDPPSPSDLEIATEHLRLTTTDREIISNPNPTPAQVREYWGFSVNTWVTDLREDVPEFLHRSQLSYKQLLELLDTTFINPDGNITIEFPGSSCNIEEATFSDNLNSNALTRIHRFLRLWRKLGWTMQELDKVITALSPDDLDEDFLIQLSSIKRLHDELNVPLANMLSWWANIDTTSYTNYTTQGQPKIPSLYEQLFLNKAVVRQEPNPFVLNEAGTELESVGDISGHIPAILAALGITEADLSLLTSNEVALQILHLPESEVNNDNLNLNLQNLSHLYRIVLFTKALKLSIKEFLSLKAITGMNPFANTAGTLRFVDMVSKIRASGFSLAELDYLLRHVDQTPIGVAPSEDQIALILDEIRAGLQKIALETTFETVEVERDGLRMTVGVTPAGDLLRDKLSVVLPIDLVDAAIQLLQDATEVDNAANFVRTHFATFLTDVDDAVANLVDHPLPDQEARFTYVLIPLLQYLRKTLSESLVKQKLGETLKLEAKTVEELLTQWVDNPDQDNQRSMDAFLDDTFVNSNMDVLTLDAFPEQFKTFTLLHKISMVITKFKVTPDQLSWLFVYGPEVGWLNLQSLPLEKSHSAETLYIGMERLVDLFQLKDQLPNGEETLSEIFSLARDEAATTEALQQQLSEKTGWSIENLEFLISTNGLNLTLPEAFRDECALKQLTACFVIMKRLGVSAEQCNSWAKPDLIVDDAISAKQAVKAKYDNTQWLAVAKPLSDLLREKKRTALVSYLTGQPNVIPDKTFYDANELFSHFLIDVEMSPCMMTSRIKQAIGSVQLFIQRCMMNLEKIVEDVASPVPEEDWARQWKWMKSYRVWEANRKVFLWPENWIESELRDDKSPFFKDLENELLQNEVTLDTAETAFMNYLEKLDAVARLEIVGMYHQVEEGTDILHVFGRTQGGDPHIYYYCRRVDATGWTAWEKVDLDIEGHHLIPVVWNRRLYLFWPIFTEKAEEPQDRVTEEQQGESPKKYWEIQLAWSEYKNKKWAAKIMSSAVPFDHSNDKSTFSFKTISNSTLEIYCMDNRTRREEIFQYSPGFKFVGCNGMVKVIPPRVVPMDFGPGSTKVAGMGFVEMGEVRFTVNEFVINRITGDIESFRPIIILSGTPGTFTVVGTHQRWLNLFDAPFFYQDDTRTFFVTKSSLVGEVWGDWGLERRLSYYQFQAFYHPYVCDFIKQLNRYGIDGLLKWSMQDPVLQLDEREFFESEYAPEDAVVEPYPKDNVDVEFGGAYSLYNWELFFHAPLLLADRLSKNQRFEEAQRWFHYIFDPTDASGETGPERYWKFRKFYEDVTEDGISRSIQQLLELLQYDGSDPAIRKEKEEMEDQVRQWQLNPFNPHLIARSRTSAYQKTVVMKYIDNLIAWGDQLFRRDTIESINEATLLYILAAEILGQRPVPIPERTHQEKTFNQLLTEGLDAFSNALVEIENFLPADDHAGNGREVDEEALPPSGKMLYFCVPPNDKLLGYWNTVADRLFKIRHCMTIEGVVRQLPLFEPPIEPGLLVRAAAMGVDISSALNDINAALPHYRFNVMAQKAMELCNDTKTLGAALLSALEKKDAEDLALLRSGHEIQLLTEVRQIKDQQIKEATETWESLNRALEVTRKRLEYYDKLLTEFAPGGLSPYEAEHLSKLRTAYRRQERAGEYEQSAQWASLIPNATFGISGWAGSPVVTATIGGNLIVLGYQAQARRMQGFASEATYEGTRSSIMGGYVRRLEEWQHQKDLADKELAQIDKQIAAADIRLAIATKDLANHDKQIENTRDVDEYMRSKFTNKELYDWMVGQISSIYFQSYQLAYDVAKRVERAYRHELGLSDSSFIQFGYWDSLKKGLLVGERLYYDLKRMELAYLDQNKREYEITKHISLAQLDPVALVQLKQTGECFVNLPEAIFDLDYPGHYMRRIKSVSLTIPCVTGPYASVNCTLTLLGNRIRKETSTTGGYQYTGLEDTRFRHNVGAIQSIVTSGAQNDSGLFELNFRDERYLPFEGAGAISEWRIELPRDFRQFDYDTISDVVLHLRYTARESGEPLKQQATTELQTVLNEFMRSEGQRGLARPFSLRHEFSSAWHRFLNPPEGSAGAQTLTMALTKDRFPFLFQDETITINTIELFVKVKPEFADTHNESSLKLSLEAGTAASNNPINLAQWNGLLRAEKSPAGSPGDWTLTAWRDTGGGAHERLDPNAIHDILIVCQYTLS